LVVLPVLPPTAPRGRLVSGFPNSVYINKVVGGRRLPWAPKGLAFGCPAIVVSPLQAEAAWLPMDTF